MIGDVNIEKNVSWLHYEFAEQKFRLLIKDLRCDCGKNSHFASTELLKKKQGGRLTLLGMSTINIERELPGMSTGGRHRNVAVIRPAEIFQRGFRPSTAKRLPTYALDQANNYCFTS